MSDPDKRNPAVYGGSIITYETGNPHFGGRTVVQLSAAGEVVVELKRGDENIDFDQKVDPAVYRELLVLLKEACRRVSRLPERTPVPGETLVRLRATTPSETIHLRFWSNQRWRDPVLDQLMSHFERLAVETSGGVVRF
jgi:hypothetical protein